MSTNAQTLASAPHSHDFFAVLRRLEAQHPHLPRLGQAQRPRDEPVRLGQDVALDFAPSAVSSWTPGSAGPPRLGQRFFGLFGPMGPMPLHLTEYVRERERHHGDASLARFADTFHHRSLLLFYRAWAQSQPATHLDRRGDDAYSRWVASFYGCGQTEHDAAGRIPPDALRHRAALLARGARSPEGLTKLLRGWFDVPVRLQSHVGHWLLTRPEDRTGLSSPSAPQPRNQLGHSAVMGARVWDRQYKFRLHLGPMGWAEYQRFLPGCSALAELHDWVRQYVGLGLNFDVQLCLTGAEVPPLVLGRRAAAAVQLGRSTWLGRRGPHAHRSDLRLGAHSLTLAHKESSHG